MTDTRLRPSPIATPRLVLEPVTRPVATALLAGDLSVVTAGDGWPHEDTLDGLGASAAAESPLAWLVTLDGVVIGDCGTHGPVDEAGDVEIGYGLAAPYRGRGHGTEVVAALTGWLLTQEGVRRVLAHTLPGNVASRRALERTGFRDAGPDGEEILYTRDRA